MLPTFLLAGLGFALAFGPLNMAATNGVAAEEQGLAGGLVNTSFQFGGALVLAVVTAVNNAATGPGGSPQARSSTASTPRSYVPLVAAVLGIAANTVGLRSRRVLAGAGAGTDEVDDLGPVGAGEGLDAALGEVAVVGAEAGVGCAAGLP